MPYSSLSSASIVKTAHILRNRVKERFPERGLTQVCEELLQVAQKGAEQAEWIARPLWPIRITIVTAIIALLYILIRALTLLQLDTEVGGVAEFVQTVEAGINDIILIGAAVYFLITIETRIKRERILKNLHELRSLAHIIDMHQLTKDPERAVQRPTTASSPKDDMTAFELTRYLDYCSEMLSLIGKIAALYTQGFEEPVVLATVNEIESLTNGLARKIWQKIMIVQALRPEFDNVAIPLLPQPRDKSSFPVDGTETWQEIGAVSETKPI